MLLGMPWMAMEKQQRKRLRRSRVPLLDLMRLISLILVKMLTQIQEGAEVEEA